MTIRNALIFSLFGGAFFFIGQSMLSSCGPQDMRSDAERGAELYHSYCEICHGTKGDGPMEEVLNVDVPDLTRLAEMHGGTFPAEHVANILSGSDDFLSHGTANMPVWGEVFMEGEDLRRQRQVEAKINELVDYLEGIQQ
jgi:hypothetical protein